MVLVGVSFRTLMYYSEHMMRLKVYRNMTSTISDRIGSNQSLSYPMALSSFSRLYTAFFPPVSAGWTPWSLLPGLWKQDLESVSTECHGLPGLPTRDIIEQRAPYSSKLKWRTTRGQPMKTEVSVAITIIIAREGSYLKQSKMAASGLRPAAAVKSLQSCPALCDPVDSSPPGSLSLGFSRQEHLSGVPFPSPMHESEKWKGSRSVMSDS